MKVLCIDGVWTYINSSEQIPGRNPEYGEIYEVIDAYSDEDGDWYSLESFEEDYEQCAFIPLSEIDEVEIAKEREGELCY